MTDGKNYRTEIRPGVGAAILFAADRTCCVCNKRGKAVQLHHIDDDPRNSAPDNLAVLCVDCHNQTQLSGGFGRRLGADLVRQYRSDWLAVVAAARAERIRDLAAAAVSITRVDKDHYEVATELVAEAQRRLFVIERTPVLLARDITTEYHQRWHDVLESWAKAAAEDPNHRTCGLLFVASNTRQAVQTREAVSRFKRLLAEYKALEAKAGRGGFLLSAIPEYCGSFIVADDRVGIWYKTRTNETGIYVSEFKTLADAYEEVFFRLAGEVRMSSAEILGQVFAATAERTGA